MPTPCSPQGTNVFDQAAMANPGVALFPQPDVPYQKYIPLSVSLSSQAGMSDHARTNSYYVPIHAFWNNMNCWNGLTFFGWQATVTFDYYNFGPGIPSSSNPANTIQGPQGLALLKKYLASGNSRAWNDWYYQLGGSAGSFPEPPRGYQPLFTDMPNVRQLVVGANVRVLNTNWNDDNVPRYNTDNGFFGSFIGQVIPDSVPLSVYDPNYHYSHFSPPTQYPETIFSVHEVSDMVQQPPPFPVVPFGEAIASSPAIKPSGYYIDYSPSTLQPALDMSGNTIGYITQPTATDHPPVFWDMSYLNSATPKVLKSGQSVCRGQVIPIGTVDTDYPYGYVPNGYDAQLLWFGQPPNQYSTLPHDLYLFLPIGNGLQYIVPPGIAFLPYPTIPLIQGTTQYYPLGSVTLTRPPPQSTFDISGNITIPNNPGIITLDPPAVVYGSLGLQEPLGPGWELHWLPVYPGNNATYRGQILFMDVPMFGQSSTPSYHLYSWGAGGYPILGGPGININAQWSVVRNPLPPTIG